MKAIVFDAPGGEDVLKVGEVPTPTPGPSEILIEVRYAGVNRADLMQREGHYPPPPGASPILGLECSGKIVALGSDVRGWSIGDRVMALLPGGGYAEFATVDYRCAMKVPDALSDEEAGAFPEVFLTAFLNLFMIAKVKTGETVLVHGGGSGVGTAAIQLLKLAGARAVVTAGDAQKCQRCLELGAYAAINYNDGPFSPKVKELTQGQGADVILDIVGAAYFEQNVEALAREGRMVLIGLMKGARAQIDLAAFLRRHLTLVGSTLRSRPPEQKGEIIRAFIDQFGNALEQGKLRPPIYEVLPLAEAAKAHHIMLSSKHFGKIVLKVR